MGVSLLELKFCPVLAPAVETLHIYCKQRSALPFFSPSSRDQDSVDSRVHRYGGGNHMSKLVAMAMESPQFVQRQIWAEKRGPVNPTKIFQFLFRDSGYRGTRYAVQTMSIIPCVLPPNQPILDCACLLIESDDHSTISRCYSILIHQHHNRVPPTVSMSL